MKFVIQKKKTGEYLHGFHTLEPVFRKALPSKVHGHFDTWAEAYNMLCHLERVTRQKMLIRMQDGSKPRRSRIPNAR